MRVMIQMVVILLLLSILSGLSLALLNEKTKVAIKNQELKFVKGPAILAIFDNADNNPVNDRFSINDDGIERDFFVGEIGGRTAYVAFESNAGIGFGGSIGVMVGVNVNTDEIYGVGVTTHEETAGIGSKAKDDPTFASQFKGQQMAAEYKVKADGGKVDAISGATVTSRGVSASLTDAASIYKKLKPKIIEALKNI